MWSVCIPTGRELLTSPEVHSRTWTSSHVHTQTQTSSHVHTQTQTSSRVHTRTGTSSHVYTWTQTSSRVHTQTRTSPHGCFLGLFLLPLGLTPSPTTNSHVEPSMILHFCNPEFGRQRQDDQEFMPIWATENCLKRKQKEGSHFYLKFSL